MRLAEIADLYGSRRNPPHRLAEFHHSECAGCLRRDGEEGAAKSRFRHAAIESRAAASSPARATAIANSRNRTRRAMRSSSPTISRRSVKLDQPVNIHLTGCPNSCAQHYMGDIGLLGTKVAGKRGWLSCLCRRRFWRDIRPWAGRSSPASRSSDSEADAGKNAARLSAASAGPGDVPGIHRAPRPRTRCRPFSPMRNDTSAAEQPVDHAD